MELVKAVTVMAGKVITTMRRTISETTDLLVRLMRELYNTIIIKLIVLLI